MTKEKGKNGKRKQRIKGFNGIATFKTRHDLKPKPKKSDPVELNETQCEMRDALAADPHAKRAYMEAVQRIVTQQKAPTR